MDRKEQLSQLLAQLSGNMEALTTSAAADSRALTDEEQAKFDSYSAEFDRAEREIANIDKVEATKAKISAPQPRVAQPMDLYAGTQSATPAPHAGRPSVTGGDLVAAGFGNHGFKKGLGEFLVKVREAKLTGSVDERLKIKALTTWSGETVGADGGYALPPDFNKGIWDLAIPPESFVNAMSAVQTNSNLLQVPYDADPPWGTSGVTAAKTAEGGSITASKLALKRLNVVIHSIKSLVHVSEESLSDIPFLASYVQNKMAEKLRWKVENYLVNGTGEDEPLGFLNAGCLLSYTDVASTASVFGAVDMYAMQAQALPGAGAFWLASPTALPALASINTGTGGVQLLNPDLRSAPGQTLLGRPLYFSEACAALGTLGDLLYVVPSGYVLAFNGSVRTSSTIAFAFDVDAQSFKATIRMGGAPVLDAKITRAVGGTNYASHIIGMAGPTRS